MDKQHKKTTHVLLITDMSGSMYDLAEDVRGGVNAYLTGLMGEDGRFRVTATLFDTEFIPLCVSVKPADVPKLDKGNYQPRGGTALLDAVGQTVAGFDLRVPELADGDRVLLVIYTDGQENSSREFSWPAIKSLIESREATGAWSVVYLAKGLDTWAQAARMGVQRGNYLNTADTSDGTAATYAGLTRATAAFAAGADGDEVARTVAATPGATR